MGALIGAQQERLDKMKAALTKRARAVQPKPKKPNTVCELCGEGYHRGKSEARRRACYVCRPLQMSRSIRAVGGGLPTLGKGRR